MILYSRLVVFRKECVLKERRFKEDIVDLAKSINKESQEVVRIARSTAEACTDKTMKKVSHDKITTIPICISSFTLTQALHEVVERMQTISHQLRILAAGEASRQRGELASLPGACTSIKTVIVTRKILTKMHDSLYVYIT